MFGFLRNWGAKKPAARPATAPSRRVVRARYDEAQTSTENQNHWSMVDGMSARSANSLPVRKILRERARYEISNNCYASGIVTTQSNDLVGTGPRLQVRTEDHAANTQIEKAFQEWAEAISLAEKLRTLTQAKIGDGEAFAILTTNPGLPTSVQLDLRLVECDQCTTPNVAYSDLNATDGIVFDEYGNPVAYHFLKDHPGDLFRMLTPAAFSTIPARNVIHWFRMDRPGQVRGIPELTPALRLFAQLRRYTLAVLAAAETAADFNAVLETQFPPGGEAEGVVPFETTELTARMMTTIPAGYKLGQIHAEQPTTTYGDFKREILSEIARCMNVPYNVAAGDSSRHNYASGRLDYQVGGKSTDVNRSHLNAVALNRIFRAFLDEAVMIPGLLPRNVNISALPHLWFFDGQKHVDPAKEASADAQRLASNTATLAEMYAERGQDWEEALRQRAKEIALMKELGIPIESPKGGVVEDPVEENQAA